MTVMEHKPNASLENETNKFQMINLKSQTGSAVALAAVAKKTEEPYSRKNSATGSVGMPASNLSLSSTSSGGSGIKNDSKFKKFANHSLKHQRDSSHQLIGSRRASGNSITIKITSENNENIEDEALRQVLNEIDSFDQTDLDDIDLGLANERGYGDRDRDEAEDTTSQSTSNEHLSGSLSKQNSKKKLKDRRKLHRSSAQKQHHLNYQESEDQIEEELKSNYNSLEQLNAENQIEYKNQGMNSAFDELFAAAQTGNSSISAIVEAKMAAVTSSASQHAALQQEDSINYTENDTNLIIKKNSICRSRNSSFRASNSNNLNKKIHSIDDSSNTLENKKGSGNALNVDNNLGAPQQLTRSCSCKRPGSFKKMKAKSSPNGSVGGSGVSPNRNSKTTNSGPLINNGSRRGTQCSITISETLDKQTDSRAGSLQFEQGKLVDDDEAAEIYRVRQFNITTKGSVINRGDSFKRSFKRSNNSISSTKKDTTPVYFEGNTLILPEYHDGFNSKSSTSSNCGLNESSYNNDCSNSAVSANESINLNETNNIPLCAANSNGQKMEKSSEHVRNFLVYVIGSSGVGKNALIKQFKTSEYRGTYNVEATLSPDDSEDPSEGVNVMLDNVESILQFMSMDFDMMKPGIISLCEITKDNDAFIVVYSITDKSSFQTAIDLLKSVRISENNRPMILVGNKSDLVRKRAVNREDGRNIAMKYGCKFVETSVAINDKVDDLLAGILKQIRLNESAMKHSENTNEMTTSFIEKCTGKRHTRNHSDVNIDDLIKKTNRSHITGNNTNGLSFRANTITRRLFRPRNKENNDNNTKFRRNQSLGGSSFFIKIFNNIFKKKSNLSNLNSVENLYTPPVLAAKSKKN